MREWLEWLKWLVAGKEMAELERWRVEWQSYRRWLSEFPVIAETLDNMKAEVDGEALSACHPPCGAGPWTVDVFRERLRKKTPNAELTCGQQPAKEE